LHLPMLVALLRSISRHCPKVRDASQIAVPAELAA